MIHPHIYFLFVVWFTRIEHQPTTNMTCIPKGNMTEDPTPPDNANFTDSTICTMEISYGQGPCDEYYVPPNESGKCPEDHRFIDEMTGCIPEGLTQPSVTPQPPLELPCDEPGHELVDGECLDLRDDEGVPSDDENPPIDCAIRGGCGGGNNDNEDDDNGGDSGDEDNEEDGDSSPGIPPTG